MAVDLSSTFSFTRSGYHPFFDFQEAAVVWMLERLRLRRSGCLALGAGMGKTLAVAAALQRSSTVAPRSVLYVTPGGLVRQTQKALARYPWGDITQLSVSKAETGAELRKAVELVESSTIPLGEAGGTLVFVTNKALKWQDSIESFHILVVDEAHLMSAATAKKLRGHFFIALSATPQDARCLWSSLGHPYVRLDRSVFLVDKTERVLELVGTARATLKVVDSRLPSYETYFESIAAAILQLSERLNPHAFEATGKARSLSHLVLYLTVCEQGLKALGSEWLARFALLGGANPLHALLTKAVKTCGSIRSRGVVRFHAKSSARGLASRNIASRVGKTCSSARFPFVRLECDSYNEAITLASVLEGETSRELQGRPDDEECKCCGLHGSEVRTLHRLHGQASPEPPVSALACSPSFARKASSGSAGAAVGEGRESCDGFPRFSSAIVRYETATTAKCAAAEMERIPGLKIILLTSSMSAAARAKATVRFASWGGLRARLHFFRVGVSRSEDPLIGGIFQGSFGSHVVARISELLVERRLLVCDQTVDVGFDLHRHCDAILVPRLMSSKTELVQLAGRASRIAVDVRDQGLVSFVTSKYSDSMDELFQRHIDSGHVDRNFWAPDKSVDDDLSLEVMAHLEGDPVLREWYEDRVHKRLRVI